MLLTGVVNTVANRRCSSIAKKKRGCDASCENVNVLLVDALLIDDINALRTENGNVLSVENTKALLIC